MKIVAQCGGEEVLIKATTTEVANLFGKYAVSHGSYPIATQLSQDHLRIGTEIKVDAAFAYVGWIYHHRERFAEMAKQMRESADIIAALPDLFNYLSIPEMKP